jgi:hypothetical protein
VQLKKGYGFGWVASNAEAQRAVTSLNGRCSRRESEVQLDGRMSPAFDAIFDVFREARCIILGPSLWRFADCGLVHCRMCFWLRDVYSDNSNESFFVDHPVGASDMCDA